jgi:HEAT repeat protein
MSELETPGAVGERRDRSQRDRAVAFLLRQLWLGLSTYRLYPENPDRPGFAQAVERVGAAAAEALAAGPVDLEIRTDGFVLSGSSLPHEDALDRLALACFERRAERLVVTGAPSPGELERLYRVLSKPPSELQDAGGIDAAMAAGDLTSVSLSRLGPGEVEEADHVPTDLAAAAPGRLDVDVLASELMVEDLHGSPQDQAETLMARLRHAITKGPTESARIDVHSAVHDMLTDLPAEVRRSLIGMLIDRVREDPIADSLIGTMSNAELTRALVDLGGGGERDPVVLARHLAEAGVRHVDIVDLTRALEAGHEEAGTIIAGLEQLGVDLGASGELPAGGSVLEVLSGYLDATKSDDVRSIQGAVASTGEELRRTQVLAVADYLALESDLDRAGEALEIWSDELRRAIRERNEREVGALLQPVRDALADVGRDRPALFESYVRRALAPDVVLEAVTAEAADGHPHLAAMLAPFGDEGVEVLLDLLADEGDGPRRALLLGALRRIVPDHPRPVTSRLSDPRWFVVRNAVVLLGSSGSPAVLPRLAQAARHAAPEVRREVAEAMANAGGAAAVPFLVELATQGPEDVRPPAITSLATLVGQEAAEGLGEAARGAGDRAVRIQALNALAARTEGTVVLQALVSGEGGPRLPWRLRRYARRCLARATRGDR